MSRTFQRAFLFVLAFTVGQLSAAMAQTWPSSPLRLIVSFPAGGAADLLARLISQPLSDALGQPVVIENKPGAGGNLGGEFVAKSAPDGYTLLVTSGGLVSINPHLYAKMPFDPATDLVPVAALARVPLYLVVRTESQAKDFKAFLADLKANPGKRNFGSPGVGSSPHLGAEMMRSMTKTDIVHVPYRGGAPALTDLLGGQLDFLFDPGIGLEHVKAGKLRLLAVGSPKRLHQFPETPTLDELGLKGFDGDSIFGVYAPAKTPANIVTRLNAEINKALANATIQERITAIGNIASPMSPAEFGEKSRGDSERFGAIIKERGITASN